jgi:beta-glucanase (GH16 family)
MIDKNNTKEGRLVGSLLDRIKVKKKPNLAFSIAAILACSTVAIPSQSAFADEPIFQHGVILPATFQAEDYDYDGEGVSYYDRSAGNAFGHYRTDNVDIEAGSGGGQHVGWVEQGEWLNYGISVREAGTYSIEALVASQANGGGIHFEISEQLTGVIEALPAPLTFGGTGGWQNWNATSRTSVELDEGFHTLRLVIDWGSFNIDTITVNKYVDIVQGPFLGTAVAVPGIIQTENYDLGGPGVAYFDLSDGNAFGHYRSDNVDIEAGSGGGQHVGWVQAGEWIEYSIDVSSSGDYDISSLVASNNSGGGLHFEVDGQVSETTNFSGTGGWQNWINSEKSTLALSAGQHVLRMVIDWGEFNVDSLNVSLGGNEESEQEPYSGTAATIPGTIQAENYDLGGPGIAYHDASPGNAFGHYRTDNVDIEAGLTGEQHLGWLEAGEWIEYTLNVEYAGYYKASARIASINNQGAFRLDFDDGTDAEYASRVAHFNNVSNTGGWQNWQTMDADILDLPQGEYIVRLSVIEGGFNIDSFTFEDTPTDMDIDSDGDGYFNSVDAFPFDPLEWQDTDGDGIGNNADLDNDNDTYNDINDAFPLDPTEWLDTDWDGIGNNTDPDIDGDALPNDTDPDMDGDGVLNIDDFYPRDHTRWEPPIDDRTLVWSDEFNNINLSNWSHDVGGQGWGNQESEYYTGGDNVWTSFDSQANSNVLVIEAREGNPAAYNCWYGSCSYTSGKLTSATKQEFMYGRIEARMKVPQTQGIWPAFWMLGSDIGSVGWPNSGEIDIMEHVGFTPELSHGALHGPGYSGNTPIFGTHSFGESIDANFHVYAIDWDENGITWYVDDVQFYSVSRQYIESFGNWVFDHEFYFVLNVAVGGSWPGSPDATSTFPQQMLVDYVRVYQ